MEQPVLSELLHNGLRVVYKHVTGTVECCGMAIMAGSRDELPGEFGLAHFVEHTMFKGTRKRRSYHVINRMETVGGELNAYTTKEETFVYTLAPAYNTSRAVELIADLVTGCSFPEAELEKEREVVADEISSYLDTPDAAVYDDFEDMIYAGSQLGHNILGTRRSLARLSHDECRKWVERNYRSHRMAFFYCGPVSASRIFALAKRYLCDVKEGGDATGRVIPPPIGTFDTEKTIRSHQAHTIMGCRLPAMERRRSDALSLVNNILGGPGMNSWLNVSLREKNGLVYTVDSSLSRYCDTTLWSVYFGCDKEHTCRCRNLVADAVGRMATGGMSDRSLSMAKRQYLGQMILSRATVENIALAMGRCALRGDTFRTPHVLAADINRLQVDDIIDVAGMLSQMSVLTFN
ncbi:MAG: insulinase family protein [Clostridiales bacterium]|nr:insulinase family protein [Clostridiales bacterium]